MPLTRENVTAASRIMLPTYVAFFAAVGLNYLVTPSNTIAETPALAFADRLVPIRVWGAIFILGALVMAVALVRHQRLPFRFAVRFCGLSQVVWATAIAAAAGPIGFILLGLAATFAGVVAIYYEASVRTTALLFAVGAVAGCVAPVLPAGGATPGAWIWPAFVAAACYASDRSLATGER